MIECMEPKYGNKAFTCPHCGVMASQDWDKYDIIYSDFYDKYVLNATTLIKYSGEMKNLSISSCRNCQKIHIWYNGVMIFPEKSTIVEPSKDMPEQVKEIYEEARNVYSKSPKASAALLRLALQYLCKELGESGKNINSDIANLVKKGLNSDVQKVLDIIRVVGNEAVHPGTIDLDDNSEIAFNLFSLMNFIVSETITRPREIAKLFDYLPDDKKEGIKNRDKNNKLIDCKEL
ncbi:TPA: DUF4145 domain-containing protein [Clostridioides difficile]|nr:DUF4145 domain-containing protein [Clostridioides difficile]HDO9659918.1 DUF4145 domain-containing protein [Clostridioides difficile]